MDILLQWICCRRGEREVTQYERQDNPSIISEPSSVEEAIRNSTNNQPSAEKPSRNRTQAHQAIISEPSSTAEAIRIRTNNQSSTEEPSRNRTQAHQARIIETESLSSSMEVNTSNRSSLEDVRSNSINRTSDYQSVMRQSSSREEVRRSSQLGINKSSSIKEATREVYGNITSAQQLGLSQSSSVEEAILSSVKFNLILGDYSLPFLVNFYGRKLKYSITQKQGYVSTSIKRNWAKKIEISYSFSESRSVTHGMIVCLSNKNTMEQTSTVAVLGSSSGKIKVNIEPDGSYTVHIVYLHINALHSGTEFQVFIQHESKQEVTCTHIRAHVPIFTVSELRQLETKCRTFTPNQFLSPEMKHIKNFYRNKPTAYFSEIKQNGGDMVPYIKDMSGDQRSPINGRIDGLFFMTNLDRNSSNPECLPPCSPFGDMRLIVPAGRLFNFTNKLYFSDFFCMKDHYASLVITKSGSQADLYCQSHLLPLDVCNNPYLRLDGSGNVFSLHKPGLWVEVMYTETVNVNMPGARWDTVQTLGRGESTPGGIPKKTYCPHCNL